jgi:uncharacterized protein DUF6493
MSEGLLGSARNGDVVAVSRGINQLSEAERRRIAPQVLKLLREVRQAYVGRVRDRPWPYAEDTRSVLHATETLVLGVATGAELRKAGPWGLPPTEIAVETLKHRPTLITDLVDAIADMAPTRWNPQFAVMRTLVRERLTDPPANPGYILALIHGLAKPKGSILEGLRADPGLLDHEIWRLFEIEGGGETSLAAHDKYTPEASSWSRALETLSREGKLSRARLLDASLDALGRDFGPFRAAWFAQFHELLSPTCEEREEREAAYLALLGSPVPATVSFAIRALDDIGELSDASVDRLSPALTSKATSTVKGAIKLLPKSSRGAAIAAAALPHATRDGQAALLAFIESSRTNDPRVAELLSAAKPALAPSLKSHEPFAIHPQDNAGQAFVQGPTSPKPPGPVESLEELVELLAILLERIDDAHEIERALDGVSRLCQRDSQTIRKVAAVARRGEKLLSGSRARAFAGESPRGDLAGLLIAWMTGESPRVPPFHQGRFRILGAHVRHRRSVLGFLSYRVIEIAARAANGRSAPILSLPTDRGGAIDPDTLKTRRDELSRLGIRPGEADAMQAALRAGEVGDQARVRFDFGSNHSSHTYQGKTYKHTYFELKVDPPPMETPPLDDVPGLFRAAISSFGADAEADYCGINRDGAMGLPEAVRWVGTAWPANREVFYAKGAAELGRNVDWWQAMWHVRCFLEPMLLPAERIQAMGTLLLSLGIAAKEPGEKSLATDVLVPAVVQQRVDLRLLGETLGRLYDYGVVKGSRIASTLSDAGRVSSQHTEAVATIIERLLAAMHGPPPPDLHAVLATLSDALAARGRPIQDRDAWAYLAGIEGSGKAATMAKALLAGAQQRN